MDLNKYLIQNIGLNKYDHSTRVMETAIKLAEIHGADIENVKTAALLHDCAKFVGEISLLKKADEFDIILDDVMMVNNDLIHGPLGSRIAEIEYGIKDEDILNAIYYHTTGRKDMSILEKIIYIADYIEPKRKFPGVDEIRELAYIDLDSSLLKVMDNTIVYLIQKGKLIHLNTIEARNCLINELKS